jgi:hypothetical protein
VRSAASTATAQGQPARASVSAWAKASSRLGLGLAPSSASSSPQAVRRDSAWAATPRGSGSPKAWASPAGDGAQNCAAVRRRTAPARRTCRQSAAARAAPAAGRSGPAWQTISGLPGRSARASTGRSARPGLVGPRPRGRQDGQAGGRLPRLAPAHNGAWRNGTRHERRLPPRRPRPAKAPAGSEGGASCAGAAATRPTLPRRTGARPSGPAVFTDWFASRGWSPRRHQLEMVARRARAATPC